MYVFPTQKKQCAYKFQTFWSKELLEIFSLIIFTHLKKRLKEDNNMWEFPCEKTRNVFVAIYIFLYKELLQ